MIDLSGQRFGRLLVQRCDGFKIRTNGYLISQWLCLCDCGQTTHAGTAELRAPKGRCKRSCGCIQREYRQGPLRDRALNQKPALKHGHWHNGKGSSEYNSWICMKSRCYYPPDKDYHNYGGRGIIVCKRWKESFENFLADMGLKPTSKHTIDRIEVNGNYKPGNCRWATRKEQWEHRRLRKKAA